MLKYKDIKNERHIRYDNYIIHTIRTSLQNLVIYCIHIAYILFSRNTLKFLKFVFEGVVFILFLVAMYFSVIVMCALNDNCASYYGMMGGL